MPDPALSVAYRTAARYVEVATSDGKEKLADLFAEHAVFHNPDGAITRGRDAIRAFYRVKLANLTPEFHIARANTAGDECWIELANGDPSTPELVATNHFTVGADGLITRLAVFLRPRA